MASRKTMPKAVPSANGGKNYRENLANEMSIMIEEGVALRDHVGAKEPAAVITSGFSRKYQTWYTRTLGAVSTLALERLQEFRKLYERDAKRKRLDAETYVMQDYLHGLAPPADVSFDVKTVAWVRLNTQLDIVASAEANMAQALTDIRGVLQADLFDSELDASRELAKNGHLRASGAVAGVVLEAHLGEMCSRHNIAVRKKEPTIGDYNDLLKNDGTLDVPNWRWVQRLGDIRNLCSHKKNREPTTDEVQELIDGVDKVLKAFV